MVARADHVTGDIGSGPLTMPLHATAHAVASVDPTGRTTLTSVRSAAPLSLRATCDGLTLLASAYGPLGGDTTELRVDARAGAQLEVRTAGAQIALPGAGDPLSRSTVSLSVGPGAVLRWLPQPLVVAEGAVHRQELSADVAEGGTLVLVETLVLGRHGEKGGRYVGRWRISYAQTPLYAGDLDVGVGAPPGWDGPAVVGQATVLVTGLLAGPQAPAWTDEGLQADVLPLAGPGALLQWCGTDTVRAAAVARSFLRAAQRAAP